jgi:cytochrome b subunit of formate dehydrogenase
MKHYGFTNLSSSESISLMWLKEPSIYLVLSLGVIFWTGVCIYYSANILGTDYFPVKAMNKKAIGLNFIASIILATYLLHYLHGYIILNIPLGSSVAKRDKKEMLN